MPRAEQAIATVGGRFRSITILTYHGISSLANFQADLDKYQEWNYTTVTPDDVWNHLEGNSTLPAKPLMVTFDDGLASQYQAAQELNTRGMKGVFYMTSGWIDGTVTQGSAGFAEATALTWSQLQQMHAWGHSIQSHTVSHTDMETLTPTQAAAEFTQSKARIEAQVPGASVNHLAYPYGSWTAATRTALIGAGCRTARAVRCAMDGTDPGPNLGRYAIATTLHDRFQLPTAGTSFGDIMQPNFHRSLSADPELIPDYGFESGGKGWSLGGGFSVTTGDKHSGTKSLTCVQGTSTVSSTVAGPIPVGAFCRITGEVWIKTVGLPAGTPAKLQCQILRSDGTTVVATNDVVTVTGNNGDWTKYTWNYSGDFSGYFVKIYPWLQGNASPTGAAWWDDISVKRELIGSPLALPY